MSEMISATANALENPKFCEMLKAELGNEEQQQFVMNFQLYLMYGRDVTKFPIDLEKIWEWLGFSRKTSAKRLIVNNFVKDVDYVLSKSLHLQVQQVHGGQNKEIIMINVKTFKKLCMIANTERGKRSREYYATMEEVLFDFMQQQNELLIEGIKEQAKRQQRLERQRILVNDHKGVPCVYVILISEENDEVFVIKLGETDDIYKRMMSLRQDYKDCMLLDVFPCNQPHKFEQYLLHRPDVIAHNFTGTEMVHIDSTFTYKHLKNIINNNIDNYNGLSNQEKLEMARIKLAQQLSEEKRELTALIAETVDPDARSKLIDVLTSIKPIQELANNRITEEDTPKPIASDRKVYKYEPSELTEPIGTYNSIKEAIRSLTTEHRIYESHIRDACSNHTIESGFRWFLVDGEPSAPPEQIPATVAFDPEKFRNRNRRSGLIAKLSLDMKSIANVYPDQKTASQECHVNATALTTALTTYAKDGKMKKVGGFHWMMYEQCSDELKATYTETLPEPKRAPTSSIRVQCIDPMNNTIFKTFQCIQEVCDAFNCCHKTVKDRCKTGDIFKGYIWKLQKGPSDNMDKVTEDTTAEPAEGVVSS